MTSRFKKKKSWLLFSFRMLWLINLRTASFPIPPFFTALVMNTRDLANLKWEHTCVPSTMNGRVQTTPSQLRILSNILDETIRIEKPRHMYKHPNENCFLKLSRSNSLIFFTSYRESSLTKLEIQFCHIVILCFLTQKQHYSAWLFSKIMQTGWILQHW